jgi:hypothetical protein
MRKTIKAILRIGAVMCGVAILPALTEASSCNNEVVVPIKFAKGSVSWHHHGVGTTFVGQFTKGQTVIITAVGSVRRIDRSETITETTEPWVPEIQGPGGFSKSDFNDNSGALKVTIPATGTYQIKTYPCAIWGNSGDITITAIAASSPREAAPVPAPSTTQPDAAVDVQQSANTDSCVKLLKSSGEMPIDLDVRPGCNRLASLGIIFNPAPSTRKSAALELAHCISLFTAIERVDKSIGKPSESCLMLAIAGVHFPDPR